MPLFSPDRWVYDPRHPATVLDQLPRELFPHTTTADLIAHLRMGGGKSLGLSLCEILTHGSEHFRVPDWLSLPGTYAWHQPIPATTQWLSSREGQLKVRSSTRREDWLTGQSGEQHSRTVKDLTRALHHASEVSGGQHPVVLQDFVEGIGIVVDLAYSQILGQPIARVSTGREWKRDCGEQIFTSATRDHEGRHEIIDPISGTYLLDRTTGHLFEGSCLRLPLQEIVGELWERVNAFGITFGVQCEIVVHPDAPEIWWLVQIRPSPDRVRSHGINLEPLPGAMITTPAVSRAFDHRGLATCTTPESYTWLFNASTGGITDTIEREGWEFRPSNILIWHKDPIPDFDSWMLEMAFTVGVKVQITRRVIVISTTHSGINARVLMPEQSDVTSLGGIIAVPDGLHDQLVHELQGQDKVIHAISDGLVGQVALL